MNKYQEAMNSITSTFLYEEPEHFRKEHRNENLEYCETLDELIKKATPMKPNEETATSEFIDNHPITVMIYRCAKCGGRVHPFDGDLYCRHCGQALDWGEEEN